MDKNKNKIEILAKRLNIPLDKENRAILNMKVSDDSNFLSPYYYDNPIISEEVNNFLFSNKNILMWKGGLTINILSNVIKKENQEVYISAIKSYYQDYVTHSKNQIKRNYILSGVLFIIGVLVFALLFILDYLFSNNLGMWNEVIDVIAWVFIWEAVDVAFIQKIEHSGDIKMAKNIMNAKIVFEELD